MPKIGEDGKTIKIRLPGRVLDALERDAESIGEKKIQTVIRMILGRHYPEETAELSGEVAEADVQI